MIGILRYLLSNDVFRKSPPPPKSVEEPLGAAISQYLGKGVQVRLEKDD